MNSSRPQSSRPLSGQQYAQVPVIRAHYADILCQLAEEKQVARAGLLKAADIRLSLAGAP